MPENKFPPSRTNPTASQTPDQLSWETWLAETPIGPPPEEFRETSVPPAPPTKAKSRKSEPRKNEESRPPKKFAEMDWGQLPSKDSSKPRREESVAVTVEVTREQTFTRPLDATSSPARAVDVSVGASLSTSSSLGSPVASSSSSEKSGLREPVPPSEPTCLTVTELNRQIKDTLEGGFRLVWLRAEISNFKAHTSGHFYFSLKDAKSQISAVMFKGFNGQLRFRPEDGMEVIVRGKVTVYEPRGNYQIFCETMEPVGAGALQKAFEQLKFKLEREGLFAAAKKRKLPVLPKHVAIVTSPTGAAIRDMLNVLGRRFKGLRITVVPTKVQGEQSAPEIVSAIALACKLPDVDVMIIGRGGGSIEDLWAFNDERVARAIAASPIPTISAVGHEIDFTIADFVADLRAPTPSAAAELVVKSASELNERLRAIDRTLRTSWVKNIQRHRMVLEGFARRLVDPQRRLQDLSIRNDELQQRLSAGILRWLSDQRMHLTLTFERLGSPMERVQLRRARVAQAEIQMQAQILRTLEHSRSRLEKGMALLESLSPLQVIVRGFSIVRKKGQLIRAAKELSAGDVIDVQLGEGTLKAVVESVGESAGKLADTQIKN